MIKVTQLKSIFRLIHGKKECDLRDFGPQHKANSINTIEVGLFMAIIKSNLYGGLNLQRNIGIKVLDR